MPTKGQNTKSKFLSAKEKQKKKPDAQKTIQIVAAIVIAVVLIAIIVGVVVTKLNQQPKAEATPETTTGAKQYSAAPPMTIDVNKKYYATVQMAKGGEFKIQLYPDKAPITVNSFVFLAREGYFDGVTFHRVLEGFMAQTGDPTGTGSGGPGYEFVNEDSDLSFDKAGVVAMANAGRDTNGSQFFITFTMQPQLTGDYTIFGQVIEGMDVVNGITRRDPNTNPDFTGDVIETITITEE
jgi:cyclophilin family peptidyl-prolyl cis-trans isomerase